MQRLIIFRGHPTYALSVVLSTSVCASGLAVVVSIGWGISNAFWAGWIAYIGASLALGFVVLRGRG